MIEVTDKKIDFLGIFSRFVSKQPAFDDSLFMDYGDCDFGGSCWGDDIDWYEDYKRYKSKKKRNENKMKHKESDLVWDRKKGKFVPKSQYGKEDDEDEECVSKKTKKRQKKEKEVYTEDFLDVNNNKNFDNISDFTYNREDKVIYFYPDETDKKNVLEFNSLFAFDEYISKENIDVTQEDVKYLMTQNLVHCSTIYNGYGQKILVTGKSYNDLVWSCGEAAKLYEAQWD